MKFDRKKLLLLLVAGAALAIPAVRSAALPFALSLFLAGCLQRPVTVLERRHVPRWLSALGLLVLFLAPLLLFLGCGVVSLLRSIRDLAEQLLPVLTSDGGADEWLYRFLTALPPSVRELIVSLMDSLNEQKTQLLAKLLTQLGSWSADRLAALPGQIGRTGLFLLFFLFSVIGYPEMTALLRGILPDDWRRTTERVRRETAARLGQWCRAEFRLTGLIFLELAAGLALLRTKSVLFPALTIALVDLIPMVGSGIILLPWAALRFWAGNQLQALGLVLLWACVWCTRTVLEPRMVGRHLQLPTALSFFSAVLGAKVWGLKGLILFPVLCAVAVGFLRTEQSEQLRAR